MKMQSTEVGSSRSADANSPSAYFRKLLGDKPSFVKGRSNKKIYARWLKDHPGHTEVPKNVMQILSNIKSQMRKGRSSRGRKTRDRAAANGTPVARSSRPSARNLEHLEMLLDECIMLAAKDEMESVVHQLRRVRREVIIQMGM